MQGEWADEEIAQSWDADPVSSNPLRVETLDILLTLLQDEYRPGKAILDIGSGSGLVEQLIFERIPAAHVVGVDGSEPMMQLARERLAPYRDQYSAVLHDLTDIKSLELPGKDYQIAISVQTLCNLTDEDKQKVFGFLHDTLEAGGLFLLLDRMAVGPPSLFSCYKTIWGRLNRIHNARINEGETFEEHVQLMRESGGYEASPEVHLQMLRKAGFEAACLYLHGHRALIAARKT